MTAGSEFLRYSSAKIREQFAQIETCVNTLTQQQVWQRGGESQNAIGNLILHLVGNLQQWILTGIGGVPNTRDRDGEFAARGGVETSQLLRDLRATVAAATEIIAALPEGRLTERAAVLDREDTLLEIIYHVVQHFSGHTGQIILLTKAFTGTMPLKKP